MEMNRAMKKRFQKTGFSVQGLFRVGVALGLGISAARVRLGFLSLWRLDFFFRLGAFGVVVIAPAVP